MKSTRGQGESPAYSLSEPAVFRVRVGVGRAGPSPKIKGFIGRIKAIVQAQGSGKRVHRAYGGRAGSAAARLPVRAHPQRVTIKARFVRHGKYGGAKAAATALREHVDYLARRGASRDGERGVAFDADGELTREDLAALREAAVPDRHHFRFIVSPENAAALDLTSYTRELVKEMQIDLQTDLQWFGVAHYDTDNPHVHLFVRGKDDRGKDLVISRDYLSHGLRLQAGEVATRRLGPRRQEDIADSLTRDLKAERVTPLDRAIDAQRALHPRGWVTALRRSDGSAAFERERNRTLTRLQALESLGLATEVSAGIWQPALDLLPKLKELSLRGDVIKTLHARMTGRPWALDPVVVDQDHPLTQRILGRVTSRGYVNEMEDREYLLIDAQHGQSLYVPLSGVQRNASDALNTGAVVRLTPGHGPKNTSSIASLSRDLQSEVTVNGVTFFEREGLTFAHENASSRGFDRDLQKAVELRGGHLKTLGLANEIAGRWQLKPEALESLYTLELTLAERRLRAQYGELVHLQEGVSFRGRVREMAALPSGVHTIIAGGGRFALLPPRSQAPGVPGQSVRLSVGSPRMGVIQTPRTLSLNIQITALRRTRGMGGP